MMKEPALPTHPGPAQSRLWQGVRLAWPVVMGYVPIGLAMGVLAGQTGLTPLETGTMSALVYAGASQFVAVAMLQAGAPPVSIVVTTFLLNLRHLLMSAALGPFFRGVRPQVLAAIGYLITDETFAVGHGRFAAAGRGDPAVFAGLGLTAYGSWVVSTVAGAWVGGALSTAEVYGLEFALPAMFIGLLAGQVREWSKLAVAVLAALVTVGAGRFMGGWSVMVAAMLAAAAGVVIRRWTVRTPTST